MECTLKDGKYANMDQQRDEDQADCDSLHCTLAQPVLQLFQFQEHFTPFAGAQHCSEQLLFLLIDM